MRNKGKGILAMLGLAAGAFAFYKYKNLSASEKQDLKDKVNDTGRKIKDKVDEVESSLSNKYDQLKNKAQKGMNEVADTATKEYNEFKN